jgi:ligand-binding sensor domain-containing protein
LNGGGFLSTNNGASWSALNSGLTNTVVFSLAAIGSTIFVGTDKGIFLSTDNCASWTASNSGLTNDTVTNIVVSSDNIFAGTHSGVFLSTNNGSSWTAVDSGLMNTYIVSLSVVDSTLFAGTSNIGVWRRSLSEMITATNNKQRAIPHESTGFKVITSAQSNRNVTISFSLAKSQPVTLKIYNFSGREVATLVNKNFEAGAHTLSWSTWGVAVGCYAVRMQLGSNEYIKNILVSR